MVIGPLQNVSRHFIFKEGNGQEHELDQVIGDQRDIDPGRDVQQNPVAHHVAQQNTDVNGNIGYEHNIDKIDVVRLDAYIDDRFRNKRQEALQHRYQQHDGKK